MKKGLQGCEQLCNVSGKPEPRAKLTNSRPMKNRLEFSFTPDDLAALAILIANLNKNGVPYSLRRDSIAIEISISSGF